MRPDRAWLKRLGAYLTNVLVPGGSCLVLKADRIAGGQSRAMYRVVAECRTQVGDEPEQRTFVVRVEQHGLLGTNSADEVKLMCALHRAGYPVAPVIAYESSGDLLGQPFFVMEYVPGASTYDPVSIVDYLQTLDRLHRLDWRAAGIDFLPVPRQPTEAVLWQIERWYRVYREAALDPVPLLEEAMIWLKQHAPTPERISLVHGDPGPGNFLHQNGRVTAITDWEFAHLGDPDEDWGYLIAMRGARVMPEGTWLELLEKVIGVRLDLERLRYWKAFNFFKGACADVTALKLYVEGRNPAPNMLAIATGIHWSALKRLCDIVIRSVL